jgi:metal-responsive CopG/Arc/MetJ family transcriptional regulator
MISDMTKTDEMTTSFRVPNALLKRMETYCLDEDISRSQLIRRLLREYFAKLDKKD